jgi:hypothetical protein
MTVPKKIMAPTSKALFAANAIATEMPMARRIAGTATQGEADGTSEFVMGTRSILVV